MEDIHTISGDFQQGSFELLTEALDRLRACHYFCDQTQEYSTKNDDIKAKWYFRAAIAAFSTTLETINSDIKNSFGLNKWHHSEQNSDMYENTLVKIITKTRNIVVHSARITGEAREYSVRILGKGPDRKEQMRSLFFEELHKRKNLKGVSSVSKEEIEWFNRQSAFWPVNLLIRHGLYVASAYVRHYIASNQNA